MSVLRKICGITRKDRRRNVDTLKDVSVEKDIVDLLQVRRLTYFGYVNRMDNDRFPKLLQHGYTHGHGSRGRPKKKWLDSIHEDCEDMNWWMRPYSKHLISPGTGHNGETRFTTWATRARRQHHRRQGHKQKVSQQTHSTDVLIHRRTDPSAVCLRHRFSTVVEAKRQRTPVT